MISITLVEPDPIVGSLRFNEDLAHMFPKLNLDLILSSILFLSSELFKWMAVLSFQTISYSFPALGFTVKFPLYPFSAII